MYTAHIYNAMLRAFEKRAFGVDTSLDTPIGGAQCILGASEPNQPRQYPFMNQTKPAPVGGGLLQ